MALKSPCTPNCEGRSGICHSVCEAWKKYEEERNKRYAERRERIQAKDNTYIIKPFYKGKNSR